MRGLAKTAGEYGQLSLIDTGDPAIEDDEVRIAVSYAGVCGSDLGIYQFANDYEMMDFPRIIGHEYSGTVAGIGDEITRFEVGDPVVAQPQRPCGECYQCRTGLRNICTHASITGIHHDGAYASYIVVSGDLIHPLPDDISVRDAVLTEPTSVAVRAVVRNSRVSPGDHVLVEGPGPIGILTAQVARAEGGRVTVSGIESDRAYRLPLADELGFETVNVSETDPEAVARDQPNRGFDVVFDTTGHASGVETAARTVRKGGQVVVVGLAGEATPDFTDLVRSEVDVQCSYGQTWDDFERAISLIHDGEIETERFIDDEYSLFEAEEAFERALAGETCKPVFPVDELRDG